MQGGREMLLHVGSSRYKDCSIWRLGLAGTCHLCYPTPFHSSWTPLSCSSPWLMPHVSSACLHLWGARSKHPHIIHWPVGNSAACYIRLLS